MSTPILSFHWEGWGGGPVPSSVGHPASLGCSYPQGPWQEVVCPVKPTPAPHLLLPEPAEGKRRRAHQNTLHEIQRPYSDTVTQAEGATH